MGKDGIENAPLQKARDSSSCKIKADGLRLDSKCNCQ